MTQSQEAGIRPRSGSGVGLSIGSLFSGIGGLELGLEWAGLGRTVYQVERDPFCREQLERNFPGVPLWGDVEHVDPRKLPPADLVCGGFPCQDLSVAGVAGARAGLQGSRSGLWSHMARIVEGSRPEWVVVENVAHGWERWVPGVRRDLDRLGYATLPLPLEARTVGAPHERPRLFVLAHAHRFALRLVEQRLSGGRPGELREEGQEEPLVHGERPGWGAEPPPLAVAHGVPRGLGVHYYRAVGNAVVPQVAEVVGWVIRELIDAGAQATRNDARR